MCEIDGSCDLLFLIFLVYYTANTDVSGNQVCSRLPGLNEPHCFLESLLKFCNKEATLLMGGKIK